MSTTTTKLGLVKPEMTDAADITAMNGNWDKIDTNIQNSITHIASTNNPHGVTKAQVGLGNVNNTSDIDKPISTAVQTALNTKAKFVPYTGDLNEAASATDILFLKINDECANVPQSISTTYDSIAYCITIPFVGANTNNTGYVQYVFGFHIWRRIGDPSSTSTAYWGDWKNISSPVTRITSNTRTVTVSSYRQSESYTFRSDCKTAIVNIKSCKNDTTDDCVSTMCDIENDKIWFMKPPGITPTTDLIVQYTVTEFI